MLTRPFPVLVVAALVSLAYTTVPILAECYPDTAQMRGIMQAQQCLFNDQFEAADSIYREHINHRSSDPAAYVFRAGALFAEMSDREDNLQEQAFKELLDSVEVLTACVLDTCDQPTAAWMHLWRGHARAYHSLYESKFGSFLSALKLGLSTIEEYEAGLRADGPLYDLYMGIGSYHYWKSAKAGLLRWLGIFSNEKNKGIAELRLAADSSLMHRELSRSALIWIWLDQREYDSAAALAEEFARRYPDGKTFLWPLAQARFRQTKYEQAAEVFLRIRSKLEDSPGNYHNLVECDYYLAQCYSWLSDPDRLRAAAARLTEYSDAIPAVTRKRQQAKINYLMRIARR
jgi:hypothetical protein